jgi:hypothetical protein
VGLELSDPWLDPSTRRDATRFATNLASTLWEGWFQLPVSAGPEAHTHHAHVEWGSFGIAALALVGRVPEARGWIGAAVRKFERDLLPRGLAPDGAQVEGGSFWASTMTTRLAFLHVLERVEGLDLYPAHASSMNADISIAAIALPARGPSHESREVVLEPGYAQLGYHAPALLGIARRARDPLLRELALLDRRLGGIHDAGVRTPSGERLRFALGPLAHLWDDPSIPQSGTRAHPLSYRFDSIGHAYLRGGWTPHGLLAAVDGGGRVTIHAGGRVVLSDLEPARVLDPAASVAAGTAVHHWDPADRALVLERLIDDGTTARLRAVAPSGGAILELELERPGRLRLRRLADQGRSWWCGAGIRLTRQGMRWPGRGAPTLTLRRGRTVEVLRDGYADERRVGYGRLRVIPDADDRRPLVRVVPDDTGILELDVEVG